MIDREHALPITRQASLLGISRGSVYDLPQPVPAADLAVMRRMDELHLEFPFAGSRMLRDLLNKESVEIGRCHVATLMKRMGIEAIYRKPNTSKPAPGHKIYPYLLRGMRIERPNQVWAMDITDVPMARGFVYLAAVPCRAPIRMRMRIASSRTAPERASVASSDCSRGRATASLPIGRCRTPCSRCLVASLPCARVTVPAEYHLPCQLRPPGLHPPLQGPQQFRRLPQIRSDASQSTVRASRTASS